MKLPRLATLALVLSVPTVHADELYSCGFQGGHVLSGNPAQGDFTFLGACGGPAQTLAKVAGTLFVGDATGNIYRRDEGDFGLGYAFTAADEPAALVPWQNSLFVAGDESVAYRYGLDGTPTGSFDLPAPASCGLAWNGKVLFGTPFGALMILDPDNGSVSFAGSCGGPVTDVVFDAQGSTAGEFVASSSDGQIYRIDAASGLVNAAFTAPSVATSLALHMSDLLVGGSDGSLLRIDAESGALLQTLVEPSFLDLQDLLLVAAPPTGLEYCYGIACPCGNDDALAGCGNGTGVGAKLRSSGSGSIAADDLFFTVSDLPAGQFGRFYMGAVAADTPFGNGLLCAGSGGYGQFRFELFHSGSEGFATLGLGVVAYSQDHFGALGQILPGQTWLFQAWYRDPQGPCGSSFNTSNGVAVPFGL